ncbi:hypothetical protein HZS_3168 [Henneguya salminicola]|nr:hypothetical protein HZS_3168 [Henneguya salminicola]
MASKPTDGHNDDFRRKWNKADYTAKIKPKLAKIKNEFSKVEILKKDKLKARNYLLDLNRKVGKSILIKKNMDPINSGGYYCEVCACPINDSINFLDHINGIKHQKNLGMSMKIERSNLDQVKARIESIKMKKQNETETLTFEQRVENAKKKEEEEKKRKKEKKMKKKREEQKKADEEIDPEMIKIMGFGSFASK